MVSLALAGCRSSKKAGGTNSTTSIKEMAMNHFEPVNREEKADINLTPMLGVVFILLIFFVVTASFVSEFRLDVTLPAGLDGTGADVASIIVTMEADDSFHINGRVLAKSSLLPYTRCLVIENPDAPMSVMISSSSHIDATVAALDAGRQAGFTTIPLQKMRE